MNLSLSFHGDMVELSYTFQFGKARELFSICRMLIIDVVCTVKTVFIGLFCFLVVEDLQPNFFTSGNMVPICLCSSYFHGHGKILFQFFWSILCRQLITLLCSAVFSNLTPGSRLKIPLNGCKKCFYNTYIVAAFMFLQVVLKGH